MLKKKTRKAKLSEGTYNSDENTFHLYLQEIKRIPLLSKEEEEETARLAALGNEAAREKLVNANLRFVIMIAKKYQGKGLPLEDLISEGNIGLLNALKNFDVEKGYRFITYAVWWIRQAIIKAIHEKGRIIRLPSNKGMDLTKIEKTRQIVKNKPHLKADEEIREIAMFLDMPEEKVENLVHISKEIFSFEDPLSKYLGSMIIKDNIEDDSSTSPAEQAMSNMLKEDIEEALNSIGKKAAEVLRCRYGLGGFSPMTLKEIGARYNLSRERVRQIEKHALRQLQHSSYTRRLESYTA